MATSESVADGRDKNSGNKSRTIVVFARISRFTEGLGSSERVKTRADLGEVYC